MNPTVSLTYTVRTHQEPAYLSCRRDPDAPLHHRHPLTRIDLVPSHSPTSGSHPLPVSAPQQGYCQYIRALSRPKYTETAPRAIHNPPPSISPETQRHCTVHSTIAQRSAAHPPLPSKVRSSLCCQPDPLCHCRNRGYTTPAASTTQERTRTHAHTHAAHSRPDALGEPVAPRVCHSPTRTDGPEALRERTPSCPSDRLSTTGQPEKKHDSISNTGPGRKQPARAKKAPPISLVTNATADLPAPIFLIAASPIIIRQDYFKRLRFDLPFLLPASTLYLSSFSFNVWPKGAPIHSGRQARDSLTCTHALAQTYGPRPLTASRFLTLLHQALLLHHSGKRSHFRLFRPAARPTSFPALRVVALVNRPPSTKTHYAHHHPPRPPPPPSAVPACHQPSPNGFGPFSSCSTTLYLIGSIRRAASSGPVP